MSHFIAKKWLSVHCLQKPASQCYLYIQESGTGLWITCMTIYSNTGSHNVKKHTLTYIVLVQSEWWNLYFLRQSLSNMLQLSFVLSNKISQPFISEEGWNASFLWLWVVVIKSILKERKNNVKQSSEFCIEAGLQWPVVESANFRLWR